MPRSTFQISRPGFVIDPASIARFQGRQVDWAKIPSSLTRFLPTGQTKKRIAAGTVCGVTADGLLVPRVVAIALTSVVVASNVATATLNGHTIKVGDRLILAGANLSYVNGEKVIASVPNANTFTFPATGADATATGTITASYAAACLIETAADEGDAAASRSGYGCIIGGAIFENLLPDASGTPAVLPAAYKTELAVDGIATGFAWRSYADSR
jgi:hypothetical protein